MKTVEPRTGSLHIGPVGAEESWRPHGLAALPHLASAHGSSIVLALDEVLSALSEEGDRLITAFDLPHDFVEVMRAAGFPVDPVAGRAHDTHDVVARTLGQADGIRPQVAGMALRPYAVRAEFEHLASALQVGYESPAVACAALVNSKTWSNEMVLEHGWAGAAWPVTSLAELERRVAQADSTVLLKDPYGVSGQGTVAIRSKAAYRVVAGHLARQLGQGMTLELLVQPLFEKQRDFSSHWRIASDGSLQCVGCLENDVDGFRYRGSALLTPETLPLKQFEQIESTGRLACKELFAAGYFGPVSIDGLVTADGTVVPCLEINARVSMGTIALALNRRAARQRLHAALEFIGVRLDATATAQHFSTFVDRLDDAGLLYVARRPGVLPITANTLAQKERGRLVLAVFHRPGDAAGMVREALDVACACGIHPEDRMYFCRHVNATPRSNPTRSGKHPTKTN